MGDPMGLAAVFNKAGDLVLQEETVVNGPLYVVPQVDVARDPVTAWLLARHIGGLDVAATGDLFDRRGINLTDEQRLRITATEFDVHLQGELAWAKRTYLVMAAGALTGGVASAYGAGAGLAGAIGGAGAQGMSDILSGELSGLEDYVVSVGAGYLLGGLAAKGSSVKPGRLENAQRLVLAVQSEAERAIASQSLRARGPVLSGVLDEATGRVYFGQNTGIPANLHPLLRGRLDALLRRTGGAGLGKGAPGIHAEINAVNQALLAREMAGLTATQSTLDDLLIFNVRLRGAAQGGAIPRCPNCQDLTAGAPSISD